MRTGGTALLVEGGTRPAAVTAALDALRAALDGSGPAVAPVDPRGTVVPPSPVVPPGTAAALRTSGSSGAPRLVALTPGALLASARATHDRLGGPGRWLLCLPIHHVAGLQVLVRSLVARTAPPAVLDLSRGFDPAALADAVDALLDAVDRPGRNRPHYTSLVPTQLGRALENPRARASLARLDAVLVGGAALAHPLRERAAAEGIRVVETYGSTETGGGCVYDGVPLAGVEVAAPGGRLEIGGATLASGYVTPDGALEPPGQDNPFVTRSGRPWVRMPDLGHVDADGRVAIHGRADDVIVTGGLKVHPAVVEAAIAGIEGVAEVVVVGLPDAEWGSAVTAVVVPHPGRPAPELGALRAAVGERIGRALAPRRLAVVDELPLIGPGKVDRPGAARLAAAILAGPTAEG